MKLLTVCVDYDDFLAITLPRNSWRFERVLVVTSPEDTRTQSLVVYELGAECYVTDAFTRNGAKFNKGLAVEEALDVLGRDGWISVMDADVLLPEQASFEDIESGHLYGAHRRMLWDPSKYRDGMDWTEFPDCPAERAENEIPGYFQLFNSQDPALKEPPWFGTHWRHAGGYDSDFQNHWPRSRQRWLPFEVLHLGTPGVNWCGRATPRLDDGTVHDAAAERWRDLSEFMRQRKRLGNFTAEHLP
jgi:hypothetical protein